MNIVSVRPDYLGPNWLATSFSLSDDDGGAPHGRPDVAVLVHERDAASLARTSKTAALYLPGFLDSFFHTEQAAAFREIGIPLVGLDMRRCGRSVRSEESRDDLRDLYVREEEIREAISYLREWGTARIILIGHSTGGLQAALWAADHPETISALILNSPWLDHNGSSLERTLLTSAIDRLGAKFPRLRITTLKPEYPRSLHVDHGGEFFFDPRHKPLGSSPVYAGFFRTVRRAHARIAAGNARTSVPLLLLHSDASGNSRKPSEEDLACRDSILGIDDMRRLVPLLNPEASVIEIPGGRHDLALSQRKARELYTTSVIAWVRGQLGA